MVKLKWTANRIAVQRMILLAMIGVMSYGIFKGHQEYEKEVSEYMNSLEYRRAKEASEDYLVQKLKTNQQLFTQKDPPPAANDQN